MRTPCKLLGPEWEWEIYTIMPEARLCKNGRWYVGLSSITGRAYAYGICKDSNPELDNSKGTLFQDRDASLEDRMHITEMLFATGVYK